MDLQEHISALEAELKAARVPLDDVLGAANVDRSTWTRWKNGSVKGARYDTMARVMDAVSRALGRSRAA